MPEESSDPVETMAGAINECDDITPDGYARAAIAALAEAGLVIVPREPTAAMMIAFERTKDAPLPPGCYSGKASDVMLQMWTQAYRAMIAAAQEQKP